MICQSCGNEFSENSMYDKELCLECAEWLAFEEPMRITPEMAQDAGLPDDVIGMEW